MIKNRVTNFDQTTSEMILGILGFNLVCQVGGVWFVHDKTAYSLGIWIGAVSACLGVIHMWWSLNKAFMLSEGDAGRKLATQNILRYFSFVLVMGLSMYSGFINPIAVFIGVMGIKAGAYLQPFTHRCAMKFRKKETKVLQ